MRKLITFIAFLIIVATINGQAPSSFTYQALLRDAAGTAKPNAPITVKFDILQGSSTGAVVYPETHNTTT
jgi:hypothetical protein